MANLICKLKGHDWQGCKCRRCGEKRDEEHLWSGCKCTVCGKERDEEHSWVGINCQACVKSSFVNRGCAEYLPMYRKKGCARNGVKPYDIQNNCLQVCERCRKVRQTKHQLENIDNQCGQVCSSCGYQEAAEHKWNGCTCTVCGQTRDKEHLWVSKTGDGDYGVMSSLWKNRPSCLDTCSICGKTRTTDNAHQWFREGCTMRCRVCGKTKVSHEFEFVRRDVTYGKCPLIGYSDDYACRYCETPNACFNYPIKETKIYRCKNCGLTETR